MAMDAKDLLLQAMHLPVEQRAALAAELIESLETDELDEDVEAAWSEELKRRLAEVEAGTAKLIPADEALRQVNATIARAKDG